MALYPEALTVDEVWRWKYPISLLTFADKIFQNDVNDKSPINLIIAPFW